MIEAFKIGWKKLDGFLDVIRTALNRQKILKGYGIFISETPSGTFVSTLPIDVSGDNSGTGGSSSTSSGPTTGGWIPIQVQDQNCNWTTIFVWGQGPSS